MTAPMSPQEMQELAAGYVLGDLTSAEAEAFAALLAEVPALQAEVSALQEALAMMPYGLEEATPARGLRSQILSAAQTEMAQRSPAVDAKPQPRTKQPKVIWLLAMLLTSATLGVTTWRWSTGQMRFAQAPTSELATVSPDGISQTWSGLSQILQDHQRSLQNPDGPVDFVVQQPADIPALLSGFQTTVAALPLLPQGLLLGGSNCQLGETAGLRLTYQLKHNQTVSAYQLVLKDEEFPEFQAAQLTLQQPNGTGIVLWRDDNYLYALVAEMPTAQLQSLAYAITGT